MGIICVCFHFSSCFVRCARSFSDVEAVMAQHWQGRGRISFGSHITIICDHRYYRLLINHAVVFSIQLNSLLIWIGLG
jgi:hypothetical protein